MTHPAYRWWTVMTWRERELRGYGLKFGPLSLFSYRYLGEHRRWSWTWLCGREHVTFDEGRAIRQWTADVRGWRVTVDLNPVLTLFRWWPNRRLVKGIVFFALRPRLEYNVFTATRHRVVSVFPFFQAVEIAGETDEARRQ